MKTKLLNASEYDAHFSVIEVASVLSDTQIRHHSHLSCMSCTKTHSKPPQLPRLPTSHKVEGSRLRQNENESKSNKLACKPIFWYL